MSGSGKPILLTLSFLTLVLVAVASFLPVSRVWGLNHLAYFPVSLRLVLLGLTAVCFIPVVARTLVEGFLSLVAMLLPGGRRGVVQGIVLGVLAIALFWGLRTGTPLLGDGHLLVRSYAAAQAGDRNVIPSSVENIFSSERIAIGTSLLYLGSAHLAHALSGMSWVDGWRLLNCVLGGIFVMLLLSMARSPGWSPTARLWLLVLVLFSAVLELFFAYPENYTPLLLALLLFVASAVRVVHFRGSIVWPIVTLALAIFLHVQALVVLPALVYVLLWRAAKQENPFVQTRLPLLLAGGMVLGVAVGWATPFRRYLLHWLPGEGRTQAVLSAAHGIDILNEIFLVFPAVLVFAGLAVVLGRRMPWVSVPRPVPQAPAAPQASRRRGRGKRASETRRDTPTPATAWLQTRAEWNLFALITWGCLLYLLFFEAEIGVARDWDLFAMIAVGLLPMALILWNRYETRVGGFDLRAHATVAAPMMALTIVLGMSWVLLNHSLPHGTRRFESILTWETAKKDYGLEALAATYSDNGRVQDAVRIMERAVSISPNKRQQILQEELEREPNDARIRTWLLRVLHETHDEQEQIRVLREGLQLDPTNMRFHLLLGELLVRHGAPEEGVQHLRAGLQSDMPPAARAHIEGLIRQVESGRPGGDPGP